MDLLGNPLTTRPSQTARKYTVEPYPSWRVTYIHHRDCQFGNGLVSTRSRTRSDGPEPVLTIVISLLWPIQSWTEWMWYSMQDRPIQIWPENQYCRDVCDYSFIFLAASHKIKVAVKCHSSRLQVGYARPSLCWKLLLPSMVSAILLFMWNGHLGWSVLTTIWFTDNVHEWISAEIKQSGSTP